LAVGSAGVTQDLRDEFPDLLLGRYRAFLRLQIHLAAIHFVLAAKRGG